ncbi:TonB-dependent receptor [Campylobacter sp.]|uniref:TonB-dependent receptor n=1 Tax=Campylobacter sp. TaxID=205 RepID=UPI002705ED0C|nr:TonB-dependent receptor [Campylobacter sp.]
MGLRYLNFALAISMSASSYLLAAQNVSFEEITVTANKIEEKLKDIPQSISVVEGIDIEEKGIKTVEDLLKSIPGIHTTTGLHGGIFTRGLNGSIFTRSNPVTIFINGVAHGNQFGAYVPITNVERVEILKGPSSAIYGKDSIGGVINVVLKEPSNEWSGSVGAEYGSYKYKIGTFEANGALIDDVLYLGLNGSASKDQGWITDEITGKKSNGKELRNFELNLKFIPTDRLSFKLFADNYRKKFKGADGMVIPYDKFKDIKKDDIKKTRLESETYSLEKSNSIALNATYNFDEIDLNSITTYKKIDQLSNYDLDAGSRYFPHNDNLVMFSDMNIKNFSQELRFSSNEEQNLRWIAGLFFENEKIDIKKMGMQFIMMGTPMEMDAPAKMDSKAASAFAQAIYPVTSKLDLTIGGRYQKIKKEIDVNSYMYPVGSSKAAPFYSLQNEASRGKFLPKIALEYALQNELSLYAMYSKGYLAGGFNSFPMSGSKDENKFESQTSDNYEIGIKGAYDNFRFSAAAFYMDIKDTHIYIIDPKNPTNFMTGNADKSQSMGIEIEGVLRATKELNLNMSASLLRTKYGNYINQDGSNNNGNKIEYNPEYKFSLGASYYAPFGLYARVDGNLIGKTYFNPQNSLERESYFTTDAKLGYMKNGFDLYLYANNITDKEYMMNVFNRGYGVLVEYAKGRTFGLGIRYSF